MYGETGVTNDSDGLERGLSPHVRGNPAAVTADRLVIGSIPACTGKPPSANRQAMQFTVYPRMYGETAGGSARATGVTGLSPHVRGNRESVMAARAAKGSIPACTGKPTCARRRRPRSPVYPRMYGETQRMRSGCRRRSGLSPHVRGNRAGGTARRRGLSPHVRGNLSRSEYRMFQCWSIPACTGKPRRRRPRRGPIRVYPRMYGETRRPA